MMVTELSVCQWIIHIWYPICSIFIILFIHKDLKKRKMDIRIDNDPYPFWLNLWSFLALLSYAINTITWFFTTFESSCYYAFIAMYALYSIAPMFLTMFQITRLQYCFYSAQVHSVKYGYPKYLFIILYCIGCILLTVSFIPMFIFYSKTSDDMMNEYEVCNAITMKKYMFSDAIYVSIITILLPIYIVWDLTVLGLFIGKVCQIKSKFKEQEHENGIYKRISFILQKITILTVLFEIKHVIAGGIDMMTQFGVKHVLVIDSVYYGIDHVISTILIYLMIEHNNDEYIRFMKVVCCNKCVDYPNDDNVHLEDGKQNDKNGGNSKLEMSAKSVNIEARKYEDQSEITTTMNVI